MKIFTLLLACFAMLNVAATAPLRLPQRARPDRQLAPRLDPAAANKASNGNLNGNANTNNNKNINAVDVKVNVTVPSPTSSTSSNHHSCHGRFWSVSRTGGFGYSGGSGVGFNNSGQPGGNYSPSYASYPTFSPYSQADGWTQSGYPNGTALNYGTVPPAPTANNDADEPNSAALVVEVPHLATEVWLNDVKMAHKGMTRRYVTPPLQPGANFTYDLRASWMDGVKRNYSATVHIKAGDEIHIKIADGVQVAPQPRAEPAEVQLDGKADAKLKLAKQLLQDGFKDKGRQWLERIIDAHPNTKAALEAKALLGQ